jgi:hypothetical protein
VVDIFEYSIVDYAKVKGLIEVSAKNADEAKTLFKNSVDRKHIYKNMEMVFRNVGLEGDDLVKKMDQFEDYADELLTKARKYNVNPTTDLGVMPVISLPNGALDKTRKQIQKDTIIKNLDELDTTKNIYSENVFSIEESGFTTIKIPKNIEIEDIEFIIKGGKN